MGMPRRMRIGLWIVLGCAFTSCCGCWRSSEPVYQTRLNVTAVPEEGVEVFLDGSSVGTAPVSLEGLRPGPFYVEVKKEGFKSTGKVVRIPDQGAVEVDFELQPVVGYLSVESVPPRATVVLSDGTVLGTTPLVDKPVPVGEITYEVRKENYKTARKTLTVQEDYRYKFVHDLEPLPARVDVFSEPSNASVWLNGQLQLESTPATFQLPPAAYTVSVYTKGYIMQEENIVVGPNEHRTVDLKMAEGDAPPGMVLIPAGEFIFGVDGASPDERPRRKVYLDAFYIDKYEVTNAEFQAVFPGHVYKEGLDRFPVSGVTWKEATRYAETVGKRLPTEIEWEKAARGTDGREFPWGNVFDPTLCNSAALGPSGPKEVGQYRAGASPFGCMDMAGNVYEWTSSWYQAYPGNTDVTKDYGQIFRVLRGGSFMSKRFDLRCARRHYAKMDATQEDYGFRCAADVVGTPGAGR